MSRAGLASSEVRSARAARSNGAAEDRNGVRSTAVRRRCAGCRREVRVIAAGATRDGPVANVGGLFFVFEIVFVEHNYDCAPFFFFFGRLPFGGSAWSPSRWWRRVSLGLLLIWTAAPRRP